MIKLMFEDYVLSKYKGTKDFSEGLAPVLNRDDLWGYINKNGKEVIPCRFAEAGKFSLGLAAVKKDDGTWGFINKKGELEIPYQFKDVQNFSEGLAAFQNKDDLWGYINREGKIIYPATLFNAEPFCEGYAVVQTEDGTKYINKEGIQFGKYKWANSFKNGYALVYVEGKCFKIDTNFQEQYVLKSDSLKNVFEERCGLHLIKDKKNNYGYVDQNLNMCIPLIYYAARSFHDDVAMVQLSEDVIGFINKEGQNISFSKKLQYEEICDFSEGLAAVKNSSGWWGYINKKGQEVIKCQYQEADSFSEGLAGVIEANGEFCYINKKGIKKIAIGYIYKSVLNLEDKTIFISCENEQELALKKLELLSRVKDELINQVVDEVNNVSSDIVDDLYELSLNKEQGQSYVRINKK